MRTINTIILISIIISTLLYAQNSNQTPGLETITLTDLMEKVQYLSSKDLEGRLAGSDGYNKAAGWASDKFKELGLKPANGDEYFQKLMVEYNEITGPCKLNLISNNEIVNQYKLGNDFVCRGFTGSDHITAPVVFCGYGISRPDIRYDDYENIDVKGKIVMVFKYNPRWNIDDKNWGTNYPREKSFTAAQHGAIGILFMSTPNDAPLQKTIGSILAGPGEQNESFPQLHVDLPAAEDFFVNSGYNLKELQSAIDSNKKPLSVNLNISAELEVHAKYFKQRETENVAALLEGSDPQLKNEYIVIGAHLDHVGSQADEIYFPGANDNASGSAGVLEIAEALSQADIKPKRSIIFVLFASEELGLNGARYFVNNSPVPIQNITAMMNMDCIASGDSIMIGGGGKAKNLWNLVKELDAENSNLMVANTWTGGGADASPFFERGIPTAYFVTTNGYEHLHYMTDTPKTLNQPLFENIVKLAYSTAYKLAMGEYQRENVE
ncbi:MAG: hypothetical protein A2V66_00660 [Ignavibacteria bacterium RBG_13_36_8]|nr:MAG: hypothetical protein A2V66_00660 [Ignavibacteria bacterium RBG_13_36_8]